MVMIYSLLVAAFYFIPEAPPMHDVYPLPQSNLVSRLAIDKLQQT